MLHAMTLSLPAFELLTAFTARLLRTRALHSCSCCLMVSIGVSALGATSIQFVEPGVKVNCRYYREFILMQKLLPDIRQLSEFYVFQQDSEPACRARETVLIC